MQDVKNAIADYSIFYLVESHADPSSDESFKRALKDNETFETGFIGASEQECQNWALEKQFQVNFIEQDFIAIADERSAKDDTLLIQYYARELPELDPEEDGMPFGELGILPRERNTWHDFRIDYKRAGEVYVSLLYGYPGSVYPVYFGRKEELTDEHGVFDVAKAERLVGGEDPDSPQV